MHPTHGGLPAAYGPATSWPHRFEVDPNQGGEHGLDHPERERLPHRDRIGGPADLRLAAGPGRSCRLGRSTLRGRRDVDHQAISEHPLVSPQLLLRAGAGAAIGPLDGLRARDHWDMVVAISPGVWVGTRVRKVVLRRDVLVSHGLLRVCMALERRCSPRADDADRSSIDEDHHEQSTEARQPTIASRDSPSTSCSAFNRASGSRKALDASENVTPCLPAF